MAGKVYLVETVHRSYKTSDRILKKAAAVSHEVDKRHYCKYCKRKRDEKYMRKAGRARYGKDSWACLDERSCCKVRKLKLGF